MRFDAVQWFHVVQCGPVWSDVVRCGPMWSGVVCCGPQCSLMWSDVIRCCPVWSDMVRCGSAWSGVVRCGPMWSDVVRCGPMWSDAVISQVCWRPRQSDWLHQPDRLHSGIQSCTARHISHRRPLQLLHVGPRASLPRRTEQLPVGVLTWYGSRESEPSASVDVTAVSIEKQNCGKWETSGKCYHRCRY